MNAPARVAKPGEHFLAFLILSAIATFILLAGLVLGTEPRLLFERCGDGSFRVTGSNYFAGRQFFSKTIQGVREVVTGNAVREGRNDSVKENQRRRAQRHMAVYGSDGARLGWDRVSDWGVVDEFMRGKEPMLALANPPPGWRMFAAWFCLAFGGLAFVGAVQSSFFPKKDAPAGET